MAALATAILRGLTSPAHLDEMLSRGPEVADLDFCDPLGRRLIHIAADLGDVTALRWIVEHGADPRATTSMERDTALHMATSAGHREAVRYLLEEASMDVAGLNLAGRTALDNAIIAGHESIVADLTRHLRPLPVPLSSHQQEQQQQQQQLKGEGYATPRDQQRVFGYGLHPDTAVGLPVPVATASRARVSPSAGSGGKAGDQGRVLPFDGRGVTKGGFFVSGAWSKAGVCSCFNVRHRHLLGKHGIVFDMGVCPSEIVPVKHVFITHGHLDHSGAAVAHARRRALSQGPPAKYYVPSALAAGMEKVGRSEEVGSRNRQYQSLRTIPVGPGVKGKYTIKIFLTCLPSFLAFLLGYIERENATSHDSSFPVYERSIPQVKPAHVQYYTGIQSCLKTRRQVKRAFEEIEEGKIAMEIVAVGPDDKIDLGQGCFVRPFLVQHRVEALGFALVRRKSEGLKPEYRGMDGKALGALKKRGVEINVSHERVEVVYTGDTVMSPLVSTPLVWKARLLIMEITYLDGDRTPAAKHQHIHVQDVLDSLHLFHGVEQLLVAHVSERYGGHRTVLNLLAAALPPSLLNKVSVALGEFGAPAHLTFLEDYLLEEALGSKRGSVEFEGSGDPEKSGV